MHIVIAIIAWYVVGLVGIGLWETCRYICEGEASLEGEDFLMALLGPIVILVVVCAWGVKMLTKFAAIKFLVFNKKK